MYSLVKNARYHYAFKAALFLSDSISFCDIGLRLSEGLENLNMQYLHMSDNDGYLIFRRLICGGTFLCSGFLCNSSELSTTILSFESGEF